MRKGMVSVGIVMIVAGIAQSARAQQQSSDQRDQPSPVAAPAPAPVPAPRFTVSAGTEFLASMISSKVTLMPSVALGYNHEQWIDTSTFSDLNMGLRLTVPGPVKRLWLAPFINYSRSLDSAVLPSKTYGGLSIAVR